VYDCWRLWVIFQVRKISLEIWEDHV